MLIVYVFKIYYSFRALCSITLQNVKAINLVVDGVKEGKRSFTTTLHISLNRLKLFSTDFRAMDNYPCANYNLFLNSLTNDRSLCNGLNVSFISSFKEVF